MSPLIAKEGDDAQHPDRGRDAYPPGIAKFLADEVGERGRLVYLAIREEVLPACLSLLASQEDGLHYVEHIDEGDVLLLIAHSEIRMLLDTLCHQEIVALTRAIDACGTKNDVGEI